MSERKFTHRLRVCGAPVEEQRNTSICETPGCTSSAMLARTANGEMLCLRCRTAL